MSAIVICQITGAICRVKTLYCQWVASNNSKESIFLREQRAKVRTGNEDVASNPAYRVAANSCWPSTPHASQDIKFWSKNAFPCCSGCDKHEFKQQIYLEGKETLENWMWNKYSQHGSWLLISVCLILSTSVWSYIFFFPILVCCRFRYR